MSEALTLEDLQAPRLAEATVYLARWGKCVRLRELTGPDVLEAAKLGTAKLASSDGDLRVPDPEKRSAIRIALALVDPLLGETREMRAAQCGLIRQQGYLVTLLLGTVLDRLTEGDLDDDERAYLAEEHSEVEMLKYLGIGETPEASVQSVAGDELADLLSVGLRIPQALTGDLSLSTVRLLAQQVRDERAALAVEIAQAMTGQE